MARKYGAAGLKANEDVDWGALSPQDETLKRQFLHMVRGSDREHGPAAASLLSAYLDRAKRETPGWSFMGFVARLIERWAAENAR